MKRYLKRILFALLAVTIWGGGSYAQGVVYETGFESSDGFSASTSYNNTTVVQVGPNDTNLKWGTICGNVTNTKRVVIGGGQSMHLRYYDSNGKTPYCFTAFSLDNVSSLEFDVKGYEASGEIRVEYSTDNGDSWDGARTYEVTTDVSRIVYTLDSPANNVRLKISSLITSNKKGIAIDNVVVYGDDERTETAMTFGGQFDGQTIQVVEGEEGLFVAPKATLTPSGAGSPTYESSAPGVASVNESTGEVTFGPEFGTATITARFAGNDAYAASSASYTIVYKKDMSGTAFYESFDTNSGIGGNDGEWGGISGGPTPSADNEGWEFNSGFGASQCVRFGAANYSGYATTPALNLSGDATLTFKAAAWDSRNEKTTLALGISGGGSLSGTSVEMEKGAWKEYTISITGGTPNTKITFSSPEEKNNRFFLDEVAVYSDGGGSAAVATTTTFGESVDGTTITVKEGEEASFTAPTATLTPAEAGRLAYSSSDPEVASVDEATGAVTLGAKLGKATITASFVGNDEYRASSASYTIMRVAATPADAITFSKENEAFANLATDYADNTEDVALISDGGAEYIFGVTKGLRQNSNIQLQKENGKIVSPAFDFADGYTVAVYYFITGSATSQLSVTANGETAVGGIDPDAGEPSEAAGTGYMASLNVNSPSASFTINASESNVTYISKIVVAPKEGTGVAIPTISLPSGFYVDPQTVEITAAEGCTIRYTLDGTSPNSGSTLYEGPITISETTTLRAIAINAKGIYSNSTRMDYEFPVACDDIAAVKQQVDGKIVRVTLKDAQVVYVNSYGNNTEYYLRDASGAIDLYNIRLDLSAGQVLNGTLVAEYTIYSYVEELVYTEYTNAVDLTITDGDTPAPAATSIADINSGKYTCDLVAISRATVTKEGSDSYVGDGNGTVQIYNKFQIPDYTEPFAGANIDIVGICIKYGDAYEILPIANAITYNFSETADNATGDVAAANVKLERTLSSDYWNTLCLPFGMTAEQVEATFGAGTKITVFNGTVEGTTMMFDNATAIEAGKPYLIKPARTTANPTIEGVTLSLAGPATIASTNVSGYAFVGTYSPATIEADGTDLFISTDGSVKKPSSADGTANRIKGMRAYISIPAGTDAKMVKLSFDGSLMGIEDIDSFGNVDDGRIYSLGGQYVGDNADSLPKGIYIRNGKKITIK